METEQMARMYGGSNETTTGNPVEAAPATADVKPPKKSRGGRKRKPGLMRKIEDFTTEELTQALANKFPDGLVIATRAVIGKTNEYKTAHIGGYAVAMGLLAIAEEDIRSGKRIIVQ